MLRALDEDPSRCGYTKEQIAGGLNALERQSVKQIGSDASHLYYLLLSKNLISKNDHTRRLGKQHGEITKLRFDKERSTLSDIPVNIRKPLFALLYQYADGAVQRSGHRWNDIELNDAFLTALPYKLDKK